ncbi:serum amyloid P-component-like [Montipora foliosa]|uniref:serum amyloid P-component-like n=1 Tax=Montipora foliosa TaxID=591990 RepID=UPI0035F1BDB5
MEGSSFAISCLWMAISIFIFTFFLFANSAINRGPTERSAQFQAFEGYALDNNVVASYQVTSDLECSAKCLRDTRCRSFNFKTTRWNKMSECQLNNANLATCPDCYKAEKGTTYYHDAELNSCTGSNDGWSNYDLYFARKSIDSYANQTWSQDLSMFTLCFWMQTNDLKSGVTFSYALPGDSNGLTLFRKNLVINDEYSGIYGLGNYYDGRRHHVCVKWENQGGSWNLTVNGKVINSESGFKKGHVIRGGGLLIIGQDQDSYPGPSLFNQYQSFIGNISGMNLWSRVLGDDEILRMSKICNLGNGDVLKWSDFLVSTHNVEVKCPSNCKI